MCLGRGSAAIHVRVLLLAKSWLFVVEPWIGLDNAPLLPPTTSLPQAQPTNRLCPLPESRQQHQSTPMPSSTRRCLEKNHFRLSRSSYLRLAQCTVSAASYDEVHCGDLLLGRHIPQNTQTAAAAAALALALAPVHGSTCAHRQVCSERSRHHGDIFRSQRPTVDET
jgi:hypothetical protein